MNSLKSVFEYNNLYIVMILIENKVVNSQNFLR